jgi:Tfp pilus assembly protein PilW
MTSRRELAIDDSGESGFSLVELITYMLILSLVLSIVGGILISTTSTEQDVRTRAQATTKGQLVMNSVQAGVRNASFIRLDDLTDAQLLTVRTAGAGSSIAWACQAWYFTTAEGGSIYTKRTDPATAIATPTSLTLSTWVKLADNVSVAGADVFTAVAGQAGIGLVVATDHGAPITMSSTATMRILSTTISPC